VARAVGAGGRPPGYAGSIVLALVGLGLLLGGLAMVTKAGADAWAFQYRLPHGRVHARAQVTDWRTSTSHNGHTTQTSHELRYAFSVPGSDRTYHASQSYLFRRHGNAWVDVPEAAWERSRDSETLPIEYLRSDPTVNQATSARHGIGGIALFALVGAAMLALGGLLLRGGLRATWRRSSYVPDVLDPVESPSPSPSASASASPSASPSDSSSPSA
jgi:hypothetical protein